MGPGRDGQVRGLHVASVCAIRLTRKTGELRVAERSPSRFQFRATPGSVALQAADQLSGPGLAKKTYGTPEYRGEGRWLPVNLPYCQPLRPPTAVERTNAT